MLAREHSFACQVKFTKFVLHLFDILCHTKAQHTSESNDKIGSNHFVRQFKLPTEQPMESVDEAMSPRSEVMDDTAPLQCGPQLEPGQATATPDPGQGQEETAQGAGQLPGELLVEQGLAAGDTASAELAPESSLVARRMEADTEEPLQPPVPATDRGFPEAEGPGDDPETDADENV